MSEWRTDFENVPTDDTPLGIKVDGRGVRGQDRILTIDHVRPAVTMSGHWCKTSNGMILGWSPSQITHWRVLPPAVLQKGGEQ